MFPRNRYLVPILLACILVSHCYSAGDLSSANSNFFSDCPQYILDCKEVVLYGSITRLTITSGAATTRFILRHYRLVAGGWRLKPKTSYVCCYSSRHTRAHDKKTKRPYIFKNSKGRTYLVQQYWPMKNKGMRWDFRTNFRKPTSFNVGYTRS